MMKLYSLLVLVLFALPALAQQGPPSTYTPQLISFPSFPTGPCEIYQVALNNSNGQYSTCKPSTRTWVTSGAGGTIGGSATAQQVAFGTAASTIGVDPNFTYSSTNHGVRVNAPVSTPLVCCSSSFTADVSNNGTGGFTVTMPTAGGTAGLTTLTFATDANETAFEPIEIADGTPPNYNDLYGNMFVSGDGSINIESRFNPTSPHPQLAIMHHSAVTTRDYFGLFSGLDYTSAAAKFFYANIGKDVVHQIGTTDTPHGNLNVMGNPSHMFADTEAPMIFAEVETNFPVGGAFAVPMAVKNKAAAAPSYMAWQAFDSGHFNFNATINQSTGVELDFNVDTDSYLETTNPFRAKSYSSVETTAPTNIASNAQVYADSTAHELKAATAGTSNFGLLVRSQPGAIHQTAKVAAISTATLCAAAAGACNVAGQYHVHWDFIETGTACGTPGTGGVTFLLTWTDSNATTHSAVSLGMDDASAINAVSQTFHFQTTLAAAWASGDFNISTNGTVIQYATGYTACGVGTGTYQLDATVTRIQ